ncbi:hypothetical protein [Rugosimonospora acidiphila]
MLKALSIHWAEPTDESRRAAMLGSTIAAPVTENGSIMLAQPTALTVAQ